MQEVEISPEPFEPKKRPNKPQKLEPINGKKTMFRYILERKNSMVE